MELIFDFVQNHLVLYIPVALVVCVAVTLFAFGFKTAVQPPFDKITSALEEDKRSAAKKKAKTKDKKGNGPSPAKVQKKVKPSDIDISKQKKMKAEEELKKQKIDEEKIVKEKNRKNKEYQEKPLDLNEGEWETVPIKSAKLRSKQDSPMKKPEQKDASIIKEYNKSLGKDSNKTKLNTSDNMHKAIKEVVNKELRDKALKKEADKEEVKTISENEDKKVADSIKPAPIKQSTGGIVFDDLGDVWIESKTPKKKEGKKKSRRD